ncbi:MAG: nucleotidyl transferase AbiEii/AbiGii toxin family protein [Xanthobacteraceae bacterium]|nr:nucleotidyl transferase AbiEii/AbiGii toxin family protein [Xanthobacteraceae bacterium]
MIPQREIIAWREHAPWSSDAQVEQDLLITRCMTAIFNDEFLRANLAMRGGTALHKVHLAPAARYSEDIDLVLVQRRRPAVVRERLVRAIRPIMNSGPRRLIDGAVVGVRNLVLKSQIIRQNYPYQPTQPGTGSARLKIEVNCSEHEPVFKIADIPFEAGPDTVMLRTYDIDEMLGTKLRALLQRDQSRDLFDLDRALTGSSLSHVPDPDRIVHAFRRYMEAEGSAVDADAFRRDLDRKLKLVSFRNDLHQMLRAGVGFDIDAAAERVRRELLDVLDRRATPTQKSR